MVQFRDIQFRMEAFFEEKMYYITVFRNADGTAWVVVSTDNTSHIIATFNNDTMNKEEITKKISSIIKNYAKCQTSTVQQ